MTEPVSTATTGLEDTRKLLFQLLEQGVFPYKIGLASESVDLFDLVDLLIAMDQEYNCWPKTFAYVIEGNNMPRGEEAGWRIDMHMIKTGRILKN
jgi:exonuclease III